MPPLAGIVNQFKFWRRYEAKLLIFVVNLYLKDLFFVKWVIGLKFNEIWPTASGFNRSLLICISCL